MGFILFTNQERMKKIILIISLGIITGSSWAQENGEEYQGSRDRLVLDLNWNGWINTPDSVSVDWYSRGLNAYFMYDLQFGNSTFSLAPGIGLGFDNIYHNAQFSATDSMGTLILPIPDSIDYKKNKFSTIYLDIPLELRFRSKPNSKNKSFKIGAGVKLGLLISSYTKFAGEGNTFGIPQDEVKLKIYKVPNMEKLRYGLTARVGYGPFNLVGFYGLSKLFEDGKGPGMSPITIGFSFNGL